MSSPGRPSPYPGFERDALNVFVTDACNKRCPYCGIAAQLAASRRRRHLSFEDYALLLRYCEKSGLKKIRILGAEPSIHPRICDLIRYTYHRGFIVSAFFTNGTFDDDELIEHLRRLRIPVTVGFMERQRYTEREFRNLEHNLCALFDDQLTDDEVGTELAHSPGALSVTFTRPDESFDDVIEAARRHRVHCIRMSPAHPSLGGGNEHVDFAALRAMKPLLLRFVETCARHRIRVQLECVLPPCIFTREELDFVRLFLAKTHLFQCFPLLDVYPDLTVRYCFGLPVECHLLDFESLEDIYDWQLEQSLPYRRRPARPECLQCEWWTHSLCQGYCLNAKPAAA